METLTETTIPMMCLLGLAVMLLVVAVGISGR